MILIKTCLTYFPITLHDLNKNVLDSFLEKRFYLNRADKFVQRKVTPNDNYKVYNCVFKIVKYFF